MVAEFPADLHFDVKSELTRILPLLKEVGWNISPIQWDSQTAKDRRIAFTATSDTGKRVHLTCPEDRLAARLNALLASPNI